MPDNFKCPNCGSGRTKPLRVAVSSGTRRRNTVGASGRSAWGSTSVYRSDFVAGLPTRPSNSRAYLCIFLGASGLVFALLVGANIKGAATFAVVVGVVGLLFLILGYHAKRPKDSLVSAQATWDSQWLCARCGHQWMP